MERAQKSVYLLQASYSSYIPSRFSQNFDKVPDVPSSEIGCSVLTVTLQMVMPGARDRWRHGSSTASDAARSSACSTGESSARSSVFHSHTRSPGARDYNRGRERVRGRVRGREGGEGNEREGERKGVRKRETERQRTGERERGREMKCIGRREYERMTEKQSNSHPPVTLLQAAKPDYCESLTQLDVGPRAADDVLHRVRLHVHVHRTCGE